MSDTSRLLGLEGLALQRVESDAFRGWVVHVVTAVKTASACPSCGVLFVSLKDLACTRPRDIPYGTTRLRLIWHKRQWRCKKRLWGHLHRIATRDPGTFEPDDTAAGRAGLRGC